MSYSTALLFRCRSKARRMSSTNRRLATDNSRLKVENQDLIQRARELENGILDEVKFIREANASGFNDPDEAIEDCCSDLIKLATRSNQ